MAEYTSVSKTMGVSGSNKDIDITIQDTFICAANNDHNYGALTTLYLSPKGTSDNYDRVLIRLTLPAEPVPGAILRNLKLNLWTSAGSGVPPGTNVRVIIRPIARSTSWVEGSGQDQVTGDAAWIYSGKYLGWYGIGGPDGASDSWDGDGDYGYSNTGIIDCIRDLANNWVSAPHMYTWDLSSWVREKQPDWGQTYSFIITLYNVGGLSGGGEEYYTATDYTIKFCSVQGTDPTTRPYFDMSYDDPVPSKIKDLSVKPYVADKRLVQFNWSVPDKDEDQDITKMAMFYASGTAAATNKDSGGYIYDLDGNEKNTPCYYTGLPTERTIYSFYAQLYDTNNGLRESVKATAMRPEITYRRLVGATYGNGTTPSISVGSVCTYALVMRGSRLSADGLSDMKVDIYWGDGMYAKDLRHPQSQLTANAGAGATSLTVSDASQFQAGDVIVLLDNTPSKWEVATISYIAGNVIHLTASTNLSFVTTDWVLKAHQHIYALSGEKMPYAQAYNDMGFASNLYTISASRNIATIAPTAKTAVVPASAETADTLYISLSESHENDINAPISGGGANRYGILMPYHAGLADSPISVSTTPLFTRLVKSVAQPTVGGNGELSYVSDGADTRYIQVYGIIGGVEECFRIQLNGTTPVHPSPAQVWTTIYSIAMESVSTARTVTVTNSLAETIATITPNYTDAIKDGQEITVGGCCYDGTNRTYDNTAFTYNDISILNLDTYLSDNYEAIEIDTDRAEYQVDGIGYNDFKYGSLKSKIFQLSGTSSTLTSSTYEQCAITAGVPAYTGTNGPVFKDMLLLNTVVLQGDHKVSFTYQGVTYTGWLRAPHGSFQGGESRMVWRASVICP